MSNNKYTTDDVFGVSRDLPKNYVTRPRVDEVFIESLARKQHIVIYGSSKQGKTSLRKKCLLEEDYVVVSCQNKWTLSALHSHILKEVGFEVKQSETRSVTGSNKIAAGLNAQVSLPLIGHLGGNNNAEHSDININQVEYQALELDAESANDIIRALESVKFNKFIVLEDFHYLPDETQRDFSFSLKTFHEASDFSFVIVGVWREENRLIAYNGDLTDRVVSVDVDNWSPENLREVINEGGNLLNISFAEEFVVPLLEQAFESVHIVQEACRRTARKFEVYNTQDNQKEIGKAEEVKSLVAHIVSQQAGRYKGFLQGFVDGFQETDLEMPKWVVYALLCCPLRELEKGIRLRKVATIIKNKHPKGQSLNNGNITQILNSAASLQNKKNIRPLVIDYDATNTRMNIVDKGFLIWLASQDIGVVLQELGLPEAIQLDN